MKYHNISKSDMLQGDGLRVALWVSGCNHSCPGCQNPITWDADDGIEFDSKAFAEIFEELEKDYVSGLTITGGDPLYPDNREKITQICKSVKEVYPDKTIWIYTGYVWDEVKDLEVMQYIDVLVDGPFVEGLKDNTYHWAGSTNQKVIDVPRSLEIGQIVLHTV